MKSLLCMSLMLSLTVFFCGYASAVEMTAAEKKASSAAGMGLSRVVDWSTQLPFLNLMKQSREWYDWRRRTAEGIELDEHGWIRSLPKGVKAETIFLTTIRGNPVIYPHYIVRWQGKADVSYGGCAKKVGRAHGGDRVAVGEMECFLGIENIDPKDPIRNITVVPEKHIAAFDQGEIFNPDFIEKIKQFRVLRFMDWTKTNGSEQQRWRDRPLPEDRTYAEKGVPVEVMLELANKVMAEPWFNIPHKADLDYIEQYAMLVKNQLNPQLNVYVEHTNEAWNWVFPQAQYGLKIAKEKLHAEGDAFMQWHGVRTSQICQVWKQEVFAQQNKRVVCVLGAQLDWLELEQAALNCPLWVKQGNRPCSEGLDAIAVAGYFSGCLNGGKSKENQNKIVEWSGLGDKGLQYAYEQVLDGRHFECRDTLPKVRERYDYFAKVTKERGLMLLAYEGGQHITSNLGHTQNDQRFSDFHIAFNRDKRMKKLYELNFNHWKEAGGGLFVHFVDSEHYSKHGSWGALEYITQETSPKWEAVVEFNQTPCWWANCR